MNRKTALKKESKILDLHLEVKALGEDGVFTGDLSVYDFVDYGGDVVEKGAFTKTLKDGKKIPMLYQHDMARPIGVMELAEGDNSLEAKGYLNLEVDDAKKAYSTMKFNLKHGIKTGLSMGYIAVKETEDKGIRFLQEVMLLEGSVVTLAANRMCAVTEVKAAGGYEKSVERKTFAEEFEEAQVSGLFYQIVNALWSELYNCVYYSDSDATAEEVQAAAAQAFADASNAFGDFIRRRFSMIANDTDGDAEYMSFPRTAVAEKALVEIQNQIQALLTKTRATSPEAGAASKSGAADKPNEPGAAHSDELTPEQKLRIRQFTKEAVQNGYR